MNYVNGEDRILYIKINGVYMPIGCLTGNGLDESGEMLDTTTRDNEGWRTERMMLQSYTISFSGLQVNSTVAGGNFNVASYDRLKLLKRARARIEWKLQGAVYPVVDYGKATISALSEISNAGELMSFSGTLNGYGKPMVQDLTITVLNNGDPNTVIVTDPEADTLIQTNNINQA